MGNATGEQGLALQQLLVDQILYRYTANRQHFCLQPFVSLFIVMLPSFRIPDDFPSFRLLGFWRILQLSIIPSLRISGNFPPFHRSTIPYFGLWVFPSFHHLAILLFHRSIIPAFRVTH